MSQNYKKAIDHAKQASAKEQAQEWAQAKQLYIKAVEWMQLELLLWGCICLFGGGCLESRKRCGHGANRCVAGWHDWSLLLEQRQLCIWRQWRRGCERWHKWCWHRR